jgi:glutamate 5-kinase
MNQRRHIFFKNAKRVVIKIGSNILTHDDGLNLNVIRSISRQISQLMDNGLELILVSSGAMASGVKKIGLSQRPTAIPQRQAVAAVGQASLIMEYEKDFAQYGKKVAQILLTRDDLCHRRRYLNARNTLQTLLSWNVVPIINENDTVVVEEIKFGDNDNLAAMITLLMDADILINLTDIDGLYNRDPRVYPDAELISLVSKIDKRLEKMAGDIPGTLGTGGMLSKIKAARKLTFSGIPMVIARGDQPNIIDDLFANMPYGTFFVPSSTRLSSRKCWIAFTLKSQGSLILDDGAVEAILLKKKSLLPSGIQSVIGHFSVGEAVELKNTNGERIAVGLVNYSAADIQRIAGHRSCEIETYLGSKPYDEVIHRDNLAVMENK